MHYQGTDCQRETLRDQLEYVGGEKGEADSRHSEGDGFPILGHEGDN